MWAETAPLTAGEILLIISGASTGIVLIVGAIAAGVVTVINARKALDEERILRKAYSGIANEMLKAAVDNENNHRAENGKEPIVLPAPVIAEGNSQPKDSQQETAALATLRQNAAIFKLQTGLPARREPNDTESKAETDSPGSPSNTPAEKAVEAKQQEESVAPATISPAAVEQIGEAVVKAAEAVIVKQVKDSEAHVIDEVRGPP